jgi:hypothetical protein
MELKNQTEPKDREIKDKKEQIHKVRAQLHILCYNEFYTQFLSHCVV